VIAAARGVSNSRWAAARQVGQREWTYAKADSDLGGGRRTLRSRQGGTGCTLDWTTAKVERANGNLTRRTARRLRTAISLDCPVAALQQETAISLARGRGRTVILMNCMAAVGTAALP